MEGLLEIEDSKNISRWDSFQTNDNHIVKLKHLSELLQYSESPKGGASLDRANHHKKQSFPELLRRLPAKTKQEEPLQSQEHLHSHSGQLHSQENRSNTQVQRLKMEKENVKSISCPKKGINDTKNLSLIKRIIQKQSKQNCMIQTQYFKSSMKHEQFPKTNSLTEKYITMQERRTERRSRKSQDNYTSWLNASINSRNFDYKVIKTIARKKKESSNNIDTKCFLKTKALFKIFEDKVHLNKLSNNRCHLKEKSVCKKNVNKFYLISERQHLRLRPKHRKLKLNQLCTYS